MKRILRTMLIPRWKPEAVQHTIRLRMLKVPMLRANKQQCLSQYCMQYYVTSNGFRFTMHHKMQSEMAHFGPRCRHLANWTKHTRRPLLWPIRSIVWKHDVIYKPEVAYCRQRRIEPRPRVICTEYSVKFGHVVFEICERTDRQRRWSQ